MSSGYVFVAKTLTTRSVAARSARLDLFGRGAVNVLFEVAFFAGLRPSEQIAMEWTNYDRAKGLMDRPAG